MLDLKAGRCSSGDFEPLFKLEHMLKDVRHCLAEARGAGRRAAPRPSVAERLYAEADERARRARTSPRWSTVAGRPARA